MKYDHIAERCQYTTADQCYFLRIEMKRIENPRRKHKIELVYQGNMTGNQRRRFDQMTYSDEEGVRE